MSICRWASEWSYYDWSRVRGTQTPAPPAPPLGGALWRGRGCAAAQPPPEGARGQAQSRAHGRAGAAAAPGFPLPAPRVPLPGPPAQLPSPHSLPSAAHPPAAPRRRSGLGTLTPAAYTMLCGTGMMMQLIGPERAAATAKAPGEIPARTNM